jgi:DNA-directed RNA polymerase subunit N (RpoN/RPB10)
MPLEILPRCTGCGDDCVGKKIAEYLDEFEKIQGNNKLSGKEKELARGELLNKLGITNDCCRLHFLGFVSYVDDITGIV